MPVAATDGLFGWFTRALRPKPRSAPTPRARASEPDLSLFNSNIRKDLLRLVLRETLNRNGIPGTWIGADMLRTTDARNKSGLHVRLLVRHWDPRLLLHARALERYFHARLLLLDPHADAWLMGFSWQLALADDGVCPPLPHPGVWTAPPPGTAATAAEQPGGGADVIAGPVRIAPRKGHARADLDQLLAPGDAANRGGRDNFEATRPIRL